LSKIVFRQTETIDGPIFSTECCGDPGDCHCPEVEKSQVTELQEEVIELKRQNKILFKRNLFLESQLERSRNSYNKLMGIPRKAE
jgi:hypothetical protein